MFTTVEQSFDKHVVIPTPHIYKVTIVLTSPNGTKCVLSCKGTDDLVAYLPVKFVVECMFLYIKGVQNIMPALLERDKVSVKWETDAFSNCYEKIFICGWCYYVFMDQAGFAKHSFDGIVFDIDNTAVPDGAMSVESQPLIDTFLELPDSVFATAATGRTTAFALPILRALGIGKDSIVANGAMIVDSRSGQTSWQRLLSKKQAAAIIDICRSHDYQLAVDGDPINIIYTASEQVARPTAGMFLLNAPEATAIGIHEQIRALPNITAYISKGCGENVNKYDVNIGHVQANKGAALGVLLSRYSIDSTRMIAIGDSVNDLPLFEAVGYRIAVANADQCVLDSADEVVASMEDGGLIEVLRRFI